MLSPVHPCLSCACLPARPPSLPPSTTQVAKDWGNVDILVHSLANGPEVQKALLETSRRGYLAAMSASSYSFVSLLQVRGRGGGGVGAPPGWLLRQGGRACMQARRTGLRCGDPARHPPPCPPPPARSALAR